MATLRATVILNKLSGKPEDSIRNVWHFSTGSAIASNDMTSVGDGLVEFYQQLGTLLHGSVSRAVDAHAIEFAEVNRGSAGADDDVVSSLLATRKFQVIGAAAATLDLPSEVAICLSINGDLTGLNEEDGLIRPKARRRGRVYLGPFTTGVVGEEATTQRTIVLTGTRTKILDSYELAKTMWDGAAGRRIVQHIVYSRASANVYPVVGISVDDAFDTVRSRGEKRVTKDSRAVVPPVLVP